MSIKCPGPRSFFHNLHRKYQTFRLLEQTPENFKIQVITSNLLLRGVSTTCVYNFALILCNPVYFLLSSHFVFSENERICIKMTDQNDEDVFWKQMHRQHIDNRVVQKCSHIC